MKLKGGRFSDIKRSKLVINFASESYVRERLLPNYWKASFTRIRNMNVRDEEKQTCFRMLTTP